MIPNFNTEIVPLLDHPQASGYERGGLTFTSSMPSLSAAVEGFEKGELIVITAPPGHGKTQLARTFSMDMILHGLNVLYLSFELTYSQLARLFQISGLDQLSAKKLILAPTDYSERDIAFVERIVELNEIDILVVDDIHSLEEKYSGERRTDNMALVIRGLAGRLKNLAIKKNIVVITMAHMRKDTIDSTRSSLSDIAYSGGIAQVADTVLQIKTDTKGNAVVEVTKSRWSGTKIKATCKSVNKLFKELPPNEQPIDDVVNQFRSKSQK